jgi:CubicO group peptidase (beta-lactamase class C family)
MERRLAIAVALGLSLPACNFTVDPIALIAPMAIDGGAGATSSDGAADLARGDGPQSPPPPTLDDATLAALDAFVAAHMKTAELPGMAIATVKDGRILFARGWGFADVAAARPVTPSTSFMLASISKCVTAVAALQLVEQGRLALDADVDDAMSWPVRNPYYPDTAITLRMLLSHTASVEDGAHLFDYYVQGADSPIALDAFLRGYLIKGGAYYYASNWNSRHAPGTHYSYSDASVATAGDLVEHGAGADLQTVCKKRIFDPLVMGEASFFLRDLPPDHLAIPYSKMGDGFVAVGPYGYPDYPDGQLRTSARSLARFLLAVIGGGALDGARILAPASVSEMLRVQAGSQEGLSWQPAVIGTRNVIGHEGGDNGVTDDMYFDPATGAGFVLLSNGDVYDKVDSGPRYDAMLELDARILELAEAGLGR